MTDRGVKLWPPQVEPCCDLGSTPGGGLCVLGQCLNLSESRDHTGGRVSQSPSQLGCERSGHSSVDSGAPKRGFRGTEAELQKFQDRGEVSSSPPPPALPAPFLCPPRAGGLAQGKAKGARPASRLPLPSVLP